MFSSFWRSAAVAMSFLRFIEISWGHTGNTLSIGSEQGAGNAGLDGFDPGFGCVAPAPPSSSSFHLSVVQTVDDVAEHFALGHSFGRRHGRLRKSTKPNGGKAVVERLALARATKALSVAVCAAQVGRHGRENRRPCRASATDQWKLPPSSLRPTAVSSCTALCMAWSWATAESVNGLLGEGPSRWRFPCPNGGEAPGRRKSLIGFDARRACRGWC